MTPNKEYKYIRKTIQFQNLKLPKILSNKIRPTVNLIFQVIYVERIQFIQCNKKFLRSLISSVYTKGNIPRCKLDHCFVSISFILTECQQPKANFTLLKQRLETRY